MAATLVFLAEIWLWAGAAVALVFLTVGLDRIDEDARGAYVFRPLLVPGVLLIWPLVLWRWWQIERVGDVTQSRYRPVRRAHLWATVGLTTAVIVLLALGWGARQDWPSHIAPVQMTKAAS